MATLKLQVQISVDGFIGGTAGEMDWMTWNWDEKLIDYVGKLTDPIQLILLGRKMSEGFIPHWQNALDANPENQAAHKFTHTRKVVFSRTLKKIEGNNVSVADNIDDIATLVAETEGDTMVYGGATFVSSLIAENIIDEYYLFVNPVILGKGLPIFDKVAGKLPLTLVESIGFECGITVLHYKKQ
ncbi:deaminase [Flavobacterium akiainvivens]|uniref:Deaminase n=1 Tax=Flavobacterium akiainvivens TaxID=1202724 RepID=A0A0M8MF73_9FLAO|nr:dihydrofolate reductase family protein [Flavobacterium akiainvivens]KOS07644.1 deaminase [Flavobacterium akiainvivens]SFQ23393.1 Dihydrofolate reductase [Flavobacterium akiainvivens]